MIMSVESNKLKTEPSLATFQSLKTDLQSNLSDLSETKRNVLLAPGNATFTDSLGRSYTKTEAIGAISSQQQILLRNLGTVESYESRGYHVRKKSSGELEFYKTPEEVRSEGIDIQEKKLKAAMTGKPGEYIAGGLAWWSTGLLSWEDPLGIKSTAQVLTGDTKGAIRTKAAAMYDLDQSLHSTQLHLTKGILNFSRGDLLGSAAELGGSGDYSVKVLTGPMATIGSAFAGGAGIHAVEGRLASAATISKLAGGPGARYSAAQIAPYAFKAGMIGAGVGMGGIMAADVYETYKKDPLLALAKGATYGAAFAAGVKGYQAAGGAKGIRSRVKSAEDLFYNEHPERIRLVFMKEGIPARSGGKIKNIFNKNKGPDLESETVLETQQKGGIDWGKPEAEIFTSRGGTRAISRITIKGGRSYEPGDRFVAMSKNAADKIGPRLEIDYMNVKDVKGGELFVGEKGTVETRPLNKELSATKITGRTGEMKTGRLFGGKKIYDFGFKRIQYAEDLSAKERGGGGGITRLETVPLEQQYELIEGPSSDIFFKQGSRGNTFSTLTEGLSGGAIGSLDILAPDLIKIESSGELQKPKFRGDLNFDSDALSKLNRSAFKSGTADITGDLDLPDSGLGRVSRQDFDLFQDQDFGSVTITTETTIPSFEGRGIPVFGFKKPGLTLTGFGEESGDWISVFGRTRSYQTGDLEKALKQFGRGL